jgi:heptosyltransferase II
MMKNYKNILIFMPNHLGDFIMALPVVWDIKNNYKDAKITLFCKKPLDELIKNQVDDVITYKKDKNFLFQNEIFQILKEEKFDLGILLTNSFSSAYIFKRGKVENIIGYKNDFRSPLLDIKVKFSKSRFLQHLIKTYKELLIPLGIEMSETQPELILEDIDNEKAKKILENFSFKNFGLKNKNFKLIGINPTAAYGPAKCWPEKSFIELTSKLLEDENNFIVFFGDDDSKTKVDQICMSKSSKNIINLAGKTDLLELASLINLCDVFVTNDSGPMHVASALKVPLVAIFGSTSTILTGPSKESVVVKKDVPCSPCFKRECKNKRFECMIDISVKEVYLHVTNELNKKTIS